MCQTGPAGEIAKAAGKGIDAGRELGSFLGRFFSGPLKQLSLIVEDKLRFRRLENLIHLRQGFDERLKERGLLEPTRRVPPKVLIPLLETALIEDDVVLQDLWVNLLANAADADSGVEIRRVFVEILLTFTPLDSKVLDKIYSVPDSKRDAEMWTLYLPEKVLFEKPDVEHFRPRPAVELSLANLMRNGCLNTAVAWGGIQTTSIVNQTVMGRHLYQALARTRAGTDANNNNV